MSTNIGIAGFSIKLEVNEGENPKKKIVEISKSLGFDFNVNVDNDDYEELYDVMWSRDKHLNKWKPDYDVNGNFGFIYLTHYQYDAFDLEYSKSLSDIEKALKEFSEKTKLTPKEPIKSFAYIYYNGSDCPFEF